MTARAPGPAHRITPMDRHGFRREAAATVIAAADNRDCDRGGACRTSAENQKRSANHHYRYHAECKDFHRISHTVQLQTICCFTQYRKSDVIVTVDSVSHRVCSVEHENALTPSLGAYIAQTNRQASAAGIEFMESPPKTLKAKLEAIRGMAMSALNQIGESQDDVSLWDFLDAPRNILSFPPSFAPAC
jgi:hypothetical protein